MKDPVCGMKVDPAEAAGTRQYQGQTYYFCSKGCKAKFDRRPEAHLTPQATPAPQSSGDTREYTCPMDPEVRQIGPGPCPKCGMALEPVSAAPLTKTEWTCPMHPRSFATSRVHARSAAWPWSLGSRRSTNRIPSSTT